MVLGLRVTRGPDWPYGEQDGGRNHVGTVVRVNSDTNVTVHWDMGGLTKCRVGDNGKHDILVLDSRPIGVRHPESECVRCEDGAVAGTLWKCNVCKSATLCTLCYYGDGHLTTHSFSRVDYPGAEPVPLSKRSISQRARALGIYHNAEVTRGVDWTYGDQDGGSGQKGIVEETAVTGKGPSCRITVKVKWDNGTSGSYRLGVGGKVDLTCKEEAAGPDFYIDHLAFVDVPALTRAKQGQLKAPEEKLSVGDTVCVAVSTSELKRLQQGRGFTRQLTGEVGIVKKLTTSGEVLVDFKGEAFTLNPAALKKLSTYKIGDYVKVADSVAKVQLLQTTRGGWTDSMSQAVGKVGKVTMVDEDGDVVVNFGGKKHVFHPACLEPSKEKEAESSKGTSTETPKRIIKPAVPPKPQAPQGAEGGAAAPPPPRARQDDYLLSSDEFKADDFYHKDSNKAAETKPDLGASFDGLAMLKALIHGNQNVKQNFLKAVIDGKDGTVKQLLAIDKSLAKLKVENIPCLSLAAHLGHTNIVLAIIDAGANVDGRDEHGNTALLVALSEQKGDSARVLIEKGANVNLTGKQKLSPLHLAVHKNMHGHLRLLLKKGANPNSQDEAGDTPLHDAIISNNDTAVDVLVADPRLNVWMTNKKHFTTFALACLKGRNRAVDKLLDREPNLANGRMEDDGYYPLHICAVNNHVAEAKLIFSKGRTNVNSKSSKQLTPLHLATLCAHLDMVKLLLSHNAEVNLKDSDGDTALHLCVKGRQSANDALMALLGLADNENLSVKLQMAQLLIEKGANVDVPNNAGLTPVTTCNNLRLREAIRKLANERTAQARGGQVRPSTASVGTATSVNPSQKCVACSSKVADTCFLPCGHQYACSGCCNDYRRCPVCRRDVNQILDLRSQRVRENVDCKVQ